MCMCTVDFGPEAMSGIFSTIKDRLVACGKQGGSVPLHSYTLKLFKFKGMKKCSESTSFCGLNWHGESWKRHSVTSKQ